MELGLEKLPWYGQIAAFLLVAVTGFLVFHTYWVVPRQEQMSLLRQELTEQQIEIARAQQTASRLPTVEAQVAALDAQLASLQSALPEAQDAGALLRRLQNLAVQSNLSIRAFTPQATVSHPAHAEWPTRLAFTGTYHNLGAFFDRVSKFSQIINITDLSIQAIDPPRPNATIAAECTATTFVLSAPDVGSGDGSAPGDDQQESSDEAPV